MANNCDKHILLHYENNRDVFYSPLKGSNRIKYVCFDVSKNYIVFGATSGGIYIFSQNTGEYLQLIPTMEGSISYIAISDNEKFIAFATKKNIIGMIELNENTSGRHITRSEDLSNSSITALQWSVDNTSLFIGDSNGRLSMLKFPFLNKTIFYLPTYVLISLDSMIVQINRFNDLLLVSTLSRCYLCDTVKNCYKQIGEKLRDGVYGACFLHITNDLVKIFSARPSSRLWEVDLNCTVHSTHEYKQALAIPPSLFISLHNTPEIITCDSEENDYPKQSFNFLKLYGMLGKYIVTYRKEGIYLFNVEKVAVLFWTNYFTDIIDVKCFSNIIYIWSASGQLHKLELLPLEKCLLKLYFKGYYKLCLDVIEIYQEVISNASYMLMELQPMLDLDTKVKDISDKITYTLSIFLEKLRNVNENLVSIETQTGMHVVHNKHLSMKLVDRNLSRHLNGYQENNSGLNIVLNSSNVDFSKLEVNNVSNNVQDEITDSIQNAFHDTVTYTKDENIRYKTMSTDHVFMEMGIYHAPFVTLASYDIIQDSLAELGTNVTEIFNLKSKNIKKKLESFEIRLNPFKNKEKHNPLNVGMVISNESEFIAEQEQINDEPIVELKLKPVTAVEINSAKIIRICQDIESARNSIENREINNSDIENHCSIKLTNDDSNFNMHSKLLNEIIIEFYVYSAHNEKEEDSLPFSFYFSEDIVETIKTSFDEIFNNNSLRQYIENCDLIEIDNNLMIECYPFILHQVYSFEDLKLDFTLRKLIAIFSELLNPFSIIKKIRSFNIPCYYASLTYVLDYFKNGDILENSQIERKDWPLPVFLNAMLLMLSLDQEEAFCQMGIKRNVNLCDVSYLMLMIENKNDVYYDKSYNDFDENSEKSDSLFLNYLLKHLTLNPADIYLIFGNRGILCYTLYELLMIKIPKIDFCECWIPLCDALNFKTKYEKIGSTLILYFWNICEKIYNKKSVVKVADFKFLNTLEQLVFPENVGQNLEFCYKGSKSCSHKLCCTVFSEYNENDVNKGDIPILIMSFKLLCSICRKYPYLWNYVCSLQKRNIFKMLSLELYIQFGYIAEVEKYLNDLTTIKHVIDLNLRMQEGYCLNCSSHSGTKMLLLWDQLLISILHNFSVHNTLELVHQLPAPIISFNKRFYQSCILSLVVENYGLDIQRKVISTVSDSYNISPVSEEVYKNIVKAVTSDRKRIAVVKEKSTRHHWGVSIDFRKAVCLCCSLPLYSPRLLQEENGGIIAFSCQHCYHAVCLKHKNSSLSCMFCCSNSKYSS